MSTTELTEAKVETRVPAGKVKSLKLSGIHNCCQPCNYHNQRWIGYDERTYARYSETASRESK